MKVHLLFEQSGTFKNQFIKMGYESFDYDIENQFNETDYVIDLFNEIENAHINKKSIFDNFNTDDLVIAFFPCTYFSTQNNLFYSGKAIQMRKMTKAEKNTYINNRLKERDKNISILNKLVDISEKRNLKLIIENPYHDNYLLSVKRFSNPEIVISDRRLLGDYYKKPTMFYFINFVPSFFNLNFIAEDNSIGRQVNQVKSQIERSLMHPTFALNFINKYILGV